RNVGSVDREATLWEAFKVVIRGQCIARQAGVLRAIRGTLVALEADIKRLERTFLEAGESEVPGLLKPKLLEYNEEAMQEVKFPGKYAEARRYGEGGRPGKVLANMIRPPRPATCIHELRTTAGELLHDKEDIVGAFSEFYSRLYTNTQDECPEGLESFLDSIALVWFNNNHREYMDLPIDAGEVAQFIMSLPPDKAPGPDGLTTAFYKAYVDELSPRLLAVYEEALEKGVLPATMREALIITLL
ncbi:hypothetical protein NDU88_007452, partial [Pleurodeles waltl]